MRRSRVAFCTCGLVSLLAFGSCSVMGLDDFAVTPCTSHADCERAQHALPNPAPCQQYECNEGLCVWEDSVERCNDEDDDCDGLIDEDLEVTPAAIEGRAAVPRAVAAATDVASGTTYVALGGIEKGRIITAEGVEATRRMQYRSMDGNSCPSQKGPIDCNFSELAVAANSRHLVYASINTRGCAFGQVRIGLGNLGGDPFEVRLGKPADATTEDASNLAFGVDTREGVRCTGASRESGENGETAPLGATLPAVAALDTDAEHVLALWLAAPAPANAIEPSRQDGCAGAEHIAVEAIGAFVPPGESDWLNGTDEGKPTVLGYTTSRTAPAVLALKASDGSANFIAAFVAESEGQRGIRLVSLRLLERRLEQKYLHFLPDSEADQVVLALGASSDVGVAWTSGCGETRSLRFTVLRNASTEPSRDEILTMAASPVGATLELLHSRRGFSTGDDGGGWFLMWTTETADSRALKLARVTNSSLALLGEVTLQTGAVGYPLAFSGDAGLRYALISETSSRESEIQPFSGWCKNGS